MLKHLYPVKQQLLRNISCLWLCLSLMACQVSEEKPAEQPEAVPSVAPMPVEQALPAQKSQEDAEVEALFEQKFIDPLTQYIEKYADDDSKRKHLALIQEERDKRCEKIADWYAKKEPTEENLLRLKGGYAYSCMPLVVAFTERVSSAASEATQMLPPADEAENALPDSDERVVSETEPQQTTLTESSPEAQPPMPQQAQACQQSMAQNHYAQMAEYCPALAQQGDVKAQLMLAKMYADGKGVAQSDQETVKWYQMAAKQGDKTAQSALGVSYYTGNGIAQDYRKAAYWQREAANQGHPEAQFILGVMYELGQGVPQDFVLAYKWFLLATSQGAKGAMESRSSLAAKLSPTQIQEGQRLAREWSEVH